MNTVCFVKEAGNENEVNLANYIIRVVDCRLKFARRGKMVWGSCCGLLAGIQSPQKLTEVTQNAPATTITGKPKPYKVFCCLQLSQWKHQQHITYVLQEWVFQAIY